MTKKQYKNATGIFSTQLAIGSFVLGTLLLIIYLITKDYNLVLIGLIYVVIAAFLNIIMLFKLIHLAFTQKNHQEYYTIKILILLANIPVVYIYLKILIDL